jgi:hypothetical protein
VDDSEEVIVRYPEIESIIRGTALRFPLFIESDRLIGLEIEHDPRRRMVASVFLPTRPSVNTAVHQPVRQIR